ncbi:MAG: MFS transporter [Propionibacterium sp.]|nr:MAG: MFS transporter [Propionibacterium sp.]
MNHYFQTPARPNERHEVQANIWGHEFTFTTSGGVFSASGLDKATAILLSQPPPEAEHILDLGCGWGPIAVAIAACTGASVTAIDVNEEALDLCRINAERAGVADLVNCLPPEEVAEGTLFDEIWSNPPIRIGKPALHSLLLHWLPRLKPSGVARIVVGKNLGADSLQTWLINQGFHCERAASKKTYRVLEMRHR